MQSWRFLRVWLIWVPLAVLFALAPTSSKTLNLGWILLFLSAMSMPVLLVWKRGGHLSPDLQGMTPAAHALAAFFGAGLLIKGLVQLHWGELGRSLSFELNAMAAVLAVLAIKRAGHAVVPRSLVPVALLAFALMALKTALDLAFKGESVLPSNAVNWAAGLGLFLCLGTGTAFLFPASTRWWYLSIAATALLGLAVFLSSKRGAYFAIVWMAGVGLVQMFRSMRSTHRGRTLFLALGAAGVVLMTLVLLTPDLLKAPINRLMLGAQEAVNFAAVRDMESYVPKGSVDTRLYIYRLAIEHIATHPLWGVGQVGKTALVHMIEQRLKVPLFHLHSEFLDAAVAYGVPGVLSSLMYPLGLLIAGWRIRHAQMGAALMLMGIGLGHFFAGLTNVNTFHNYYQTMFAVCVVLPFLLSPLSAIRVNAD